VTGDPRLRFRVYVAGEIVAEDWVDASKPSAQEDVNAALAAHQDLVDDAEADGLLWLVEIHDPEREGDDAYIRFGTDKRRMTEPVQISPRYL
jgi:hypothetical protein